jgi:Fic family protein
VTVGTLDDPSGAGRFRRPEERVVVTDDTEEVLHDPPPAGELEGRMRLMCEFANARTPDYFIHPLIRSIILHFWLAYDHPFVDGNGRTARALFYWSMLKHGYWLFEYVSISKAILQAPIQYGTAFLHTESDENDLTYFLGWQNLFEGVGDRPWWCQRRCPGHLTRPSSRWSGPPHQPRPTPQAGFAILAYFMLYHADVIRKAVDELYQYVERRTAEVRGLEAALRGLTELNHRQRDLIRHALRHPGTLYTIEAHRNSHGVVYQTARTDLLGLERRKLFRKRKVGKTWYFTAAPDLEERLRSP